MNKKKHYKYGLQGNKVCFCCANPYSFWNNEIPITSPSKENALSISVKSAL